MDYAAYYAGSQWTKDALEAELSRWMGVLDAAQSGGRDRNIAGPDGVSVNIEHVDIRDVEARIGFIQEAIALKDPDNAPPQAVRMILPTFGAIPH